MRDPRLPAAGSVLTREYKGKTLRVSVLEEGFRWERNDYRSLAALAGAITGSKSINGFLWFKLAEPTPARSETVKHVRKETRKVASDLTPETSAI